MHQFKNAQVIILETQKETNIILDNGKLEFIKNKQIAKTINSCVVGYNLYIVNDDKINVTDWCYNIVSKTVFQADKQLIKLINSPNVVLTTNKKVIATTDTSLIIDCVHEFRHNINDNFICHKCNKSVLRSEITYQNKSLPQPSKEWIEYFISEYNKENVITDVLVEYEEYFIQNDEIYIHSSGAKGNYSTHDYKFKINSDNTISIKPTIEIQHFIDEQIGEVIEVTIESKRDNWNREEVINLLYKHTEDMFSQRIELEQWIANNL